MSFNKIIITWIYYETDINIVLFCITGNLYQFFDICDSDEILDYI